MLKSRNLPFAHGLRLPSRPPPVKHNCANYTKFYQNFCELTSPLPHFENPVYAVYAAKQLKRSAHCTLFQNFRAFQNMGRTLIVCQKYVGNLVAEMQLIKIILMGTKSGTIWYFIGSALCSHLSIMFNKYNKQNKERNKATLGLLNYLLLFSQSSYFQMVFQCPRKRGFSTRNSSWRRIWTRAVCPSMKRPCTWKRLKSTCCDKVPSRMQ